MNMIVAAHRCGTEKYPELTLDAASYSLELGADFVEMDIRFTKDQIPVISHDKDGIKLFGTAKDVCELSIGEFKGLRFICKPEYHPHTLEEVLKSGVGPILFHIKEGGGQLGAILQKISEYGYEENVIMGVQSAADVVTVKEFNPGMKVLAFMQSEEAVDDFLETGVDIIRLWEEWVTEEKVQYIHDRGRQIWVMAGSSAKHTTGYTSREELLKWKMMGIDGVIINEVSKTRMLLQEVQ